MDDLITKYLGIDWGEKRIGLATADSETKLAIPFQTAHSLAEVLEIIQQDDINVVVVGSPKKMSGQAASSSAWQSFIKQLEKYTGLTVQLLDERLSSLAADALSGRHQEKAARDEIAAALILQDYLDTH